MATVEVEDDEAWLYGDEKKEDSTAKEESAPTESSKALSAEAPPFEPKSKSTSNGDAVEDKEAGEVSGDDAGGDDDDEDDDDDSDDDVQVVIGDINKVAQPSFEKFKSTYQRPAAVTTKPPTKGVDLDAVGTINGTNLFEFDINTLEDKPWRKPGADITDYFNYGFNEDTWIKYSEKQRRLRVESGNTTHVAKPFVPMPSSRPVKTVESVATPTGKPSRIGPPPGRKLSGTIDVIGSSTRDSRRQHGDHYSDQVGSSEPVDNYKKYPPPQGPPPGMLPPTHMPPPNFNTPPPQLPPPGHPPPHMGGPPPQFYPPPGGPPPTGPPPGYDNRPPPGYGGFDPFHGGPPPHFGAPPNQGGPPPWEHRPPDGNPFTGPWDYQGHHPQMSDSEFSSSEDERDRSRYSRGREMYDPFESDSRGERDYRRDGHDRSRSKDRERKHRDRDDRHSSKSRRKHDGDDHSRKHKKSKRSKRDREDEGTEATETAAN